MSGYDDDPFGADEPAAAAGSVDIEAGEEPTTHFGSADEFVRKQLIGTYLRRVTAQGSDGGLRWKASWWESKEAQQRIEALWRAGEAARADPKAGMSAWWINHCDPHMSVLLSADGPFADSTDENRIGEPLPYEAPVEARSRRICNRRCTRSVRATSTGDVEEAARFRPRSPGWQSRSTS